MAAHDGFSVRRYSDRHAGDGGAGAPQLPIWIGYLIIVSSLSAVHTTRYVVLFAVWAVVAYWMGIAALDLTGRADPSWQIATSSRSC